MLIAMETHNGYMAQPTTLAVSIEISGGENVPGIPGACATRNVAYLVKGPSQ